LGLFAYPNLIALDLENQKSNSVVPGILIHTNPDFSIDPSLNALLSIYPISTYDLSLSVSR
jgi:hypothetical protein